MAGRLSQDQVNFLGRVINEIETAGTNLYAQTGSIMSYKDVMELLTNRAIKALAYQEERNDGEPKHEVQQASLEQAGAPTHGGQG